MAGFSANQQQFLNAVVQNTGLHPGVVAAWMAAEEPVGAKAGYGGTQNWLNVGITDSGPRGASNAIWRNPAAAGKATAAWIKGMSDPGFGHATPGIRAIAQTAGRSPQAQLAAIQHSGWATSGYPDLPGLFHTYGNTKAAGVPTTTPGATSNGGGRSLTATPVSYRAVTTHGFDQAAFDQAQAASIAGNYISGQKDPYAAGQPRTGLSNATSSNPLFSSGTLSTVAPNPADYQTAQTQLQKIAGQSVTVGAHPLASSAAAAHVAAGGQMNPFPHGYTPSRLDKGFDGTSHGPIASPVTGKVVFSSPSFSNWGGYVAVKADHPIPGLASDTFYFAEGLHPTVKLGQRVTAGQTIALPVASRWNGIVGNLEWGLANPANPGDVFGKGQNTRSEVLALYNWARKNFGLGAATSTGTAGAF